MDDDINEAYDQGVEIIEKAGDYFSKGSEVISIFQPILQKANKVIDNVAPWLSPIGIGLKLSFAMINMINWAIGGN